MVSFFAPLLILFPLHLLPSYCSGQEIQFINLNFYFYLYILFKVIIYRSINSVPLLLSLHFNFLAFRLHICNKMKMYIILNPNAKNSTLSPCSAIIINKYKTGKQQLVQKNTTRLSYLETKWIRSRLLWYKQEENQSKSFKLIKYFLILWMMMMMMVRLQL